MCVDNAACFKRQGGKNSLQHSDYQPGYETKTGAKHSNRHCNKLSNSESRVRKKNVFSNATYEYALETRSPICLRTCEIRRQAHQIEA
jgi:hypothetical protein